MKKIYLVIGLMSTCFFSFGQIFPIDFEPTGYGASWTWTTFENGPTPPPLQIVANPNPSGINTSSTVAKFTALGFGVGGQPWAGFETSHGAGVGVFTVSSANPIIKMMVYKTKISPVGLKLVNSTSASLGQVLVTNTVVNQWQELTFDFTNHINSVHNPFDQLVVFPDWSVRAGVSTDTIYVDNIGWGCKKSYNSLTFNAASSYTTASGTVLSSTGVFKDSIPNASGCDSVITLDLKIAIANQTVTGGNVAVCPGDSTAISLTSSETGVNYYLRNNANNSIIDGPKAGTNGSIFFNTGAINSTTSYNIQGKTSAMLSTNTGALVFTGNSGQKKVSLGTNLWSSNFVGQTQLTVEAWVKRTSSSPSLQTIAGNYQSSYPMLLRVDNDKISFYLNSSAVATSVNNILLNQWTHVAGTYDGANIKVYINGVLEATTAYSTALIPATEEMKIGGGLSNGSEYFPGLITDVRFWTIAKTQSEINTNRMSILNGNEPNLVAYYKFAETSGSTTANSVTGNAYTGTLINNPVRATGLSLLALTNCERQMNIIATVVSINPAICSVGIKENSFGTGLAMFPNPTNGKFEIEFENTEKLIIVRISSIAGQLVEEYTFRNSKHIQLETKQPAGMYFVEISNGESNKTVLKLIKQ